MPIDISDKEGFPVNLTGTQMNDAIVQAHKSKDAIANIQNLQSTDSEIDNTTDFYTDNFKGESITEYDGISGSTTLDQTYVLENTGDYIEYAARHNNIAGGYLVNTGLFGLNDGGTNNTIGFNSGDNMYLRGSTSDWIIFNDTGINHNVFNKYKFIVNGLNLDLYVNDTYIKSAVLASPISINGIGNCYGADNFVNASLKSVEIFTSLNSLALVNDIHNQNTFTNTDTTETIIDKEFDFSPFPTKLRVVYDGANKIDIYKPIANRKYVRYEFERSQFAPNSDNWTIFMASICNEDFTTNQKIFNGGACETAIKISDGTSSADDFIGGQAHGDEVLTEFFCFVDSVKMDMSTSFDILCDELTFIQKSNLYAPSGVTYAGEQVATDVLTWYFSSIEPEKIGHNLTFTKETTLLDTYLFMLPVLRLSLGVQVTDTFMIEPEYVEYDVSLEGHTNNQHYDVTQMDNVRLWGNTSKIGVSARVLQGMLSSGSFNVSPSPSYNKLYFDMTGNIDVTAGDNFKTLSEFNITYLGE